MSAIKEYYHDQIEAGQRGKQHKISWLNMPGYKPETWNPVVGCSKVSPGCENCYAERMAIRLASMPNRNVSFDYKCVLFPDQNNKQTSWNGHTLFRQEQLLIPLKWKTPRMVFVCSMSDLFHEQTDFEKIDAVFTVMSDLDQHIYVILTKRPERMYNFFKWKTERFGIPWRAKDNVWLGVTAENQEQANKRIPILLRIPATKRFVSIEPMLGAVDLNWIDDGPKRAIDALVVDSITYNDEVVNKGLAWVICGGESGPKARPMHPDWVRSVRDQCTNSSTPFFFKQWGEWIPVATGDGKQYLPFGNYNPETRFGYRRKKAQYKQDILDGQQHHEWPTSIDSVAEKINL